MFQKDKNNLITVNRFNNIIKSSFSVTLKKAGFKKKSSKYLLETEYFTYEVSIQKSRWNSKEKLSFTLNFYIFLPKEVTEKLPFIFLAPIFGGWVTILCKNDSHWFDINEDDSNYEQKDNEIIEKIENMLTNCLLPFLTKIKNLNDIIPLLDENDKKRHQWNVPHTGGQTKEFLAVIYYILGNKNKSIEIIEESIAKSEVKSFATRMEIFKQEILNDRL